jgi:hypothetical protein
MRTLVQIRVGWRDVEVLGTEGLRRDPKTIGKYTTFQVPGGTQALRRAEVVRVCLNEAPPVELMRPGLLGAILIKARVVAKQRSLKFDSDRQDLIRLLTFIGDARALVKEEELKKSEKKWLRAIEPLLDFKDPALPQLFHGGEIARAEQACRLLIA